VLLCEDGRAPAEALVVRTAAQRAVEHGDDDGVHPQLPERAPVDVDGVQERPTHRLVEAKEQPARVPERAAAVEGQVAAPVRAPHRPTAAGVAERQRHPLKVLAPARQQAPVVGDVLAAALEPRRAAPPARVADDAPARERARERRAPAAATAGE